MRSYDEVTNNLLERRDKYNEVQRAKKKTIVRISSFVSCFVIVAILGIGIWQGGWLDCNYNHSYKYKCTRLLMQAGIFCSPERS